MRGKSWAGDVELDVYKAIKWRRNLEGQSCDWPNSEAVKFCLEISKMRFRLLTWSFMEGEEDFQIRSNLGDASFTFCCCFKKTIH